jgi:anti-sigma regulatory factor (Ser/Thr protein kinase)
MNDVSTIPLQTEGIRLTLPAVAANIALVRQVLSGIADGIGVDPALTADMKIAITEACTNVVMHAYPDQPGPVEISIERLGVNLAVGVRDAGIGFRPLAPFDAATDPEAQPPTVGFGLALIASLSDEFGIVSGPNGTEVKMVFALGDEPPPDAARLFANAGRPSPAAAGTEQVTLRIGRDEPVVEVLGRLVSLLAARAGFSIDRLSDVQLISDAVATHAPRHVRNGALSVSFIEHGDSFELQLGPFEADQARQFVAAATLPGVGSLLERLSDEVAIEPERAAPGVSRSEHLRLRVGRTGPGTVAPAG